MKKVLIVDDTIVLNENLKASYKKKIENEGFKIEILGCFEDASDYINKSCPDVLVVDTRFPFRKGGNAEENYEPLINYYREKCPKDQIKDHIIVISGDENILSRIKYTGCVRDENGQMLVKILKGESEGYKAEGPYLVQCFSSLKHRVAHLFLSMDVDLQGIGVLRKQVAGDKIQNAANTPKAYLRDVLNNKEKTFYRQKLADLQFLIAKVSRGKKKPFLECDGEPSGEPARPTLSKSNLPDDPDDKAIVGLISEEKRNDDSVVCLWNTLVDLSGLKLKDANKPFENISSYTNSSIFKFMCLMDCKVDKKNDINEQDVNDVMKIEGGKVWTVKGANPSPIKCFNDWFCALDDCLEKLRKVIKPD
jgi:hypothetical protein